MLSGLFSRITRLELIVAAIAAIVLAGLAIAEPDVLEAPFENTRTVVFTFGGTAIAAVVLVVLLWLRAPATLRVVVLGLPFVAVSWWLISPFFIDETVDDEFSTSIAAATEEVPVTAASPTTTVAGTPSPPTTVASAPAAPALLGAGQFVGLAGHDGTGDAGFFALEDGTLALRFENFDIQNGPDLQLYVVPGGGQTAPGDDSLYLGALRGNVGDQTYALPVEFALTPGDWTVLVWCEAFAVEFVAATVTVA